MTTSSSVSSTASHLHLSPRQATAVHAILRRYRGKGSAYLLPCLHDVQAITGWLDADLAAQIAESLDIPAVQVHNVIEFYALFYDHPVGRTIVRVCDDLACYLAGSEAIVRACAAHLGLDPEHGGTTADGAFTLEIHPCLGRCEQAPFLMIGDEAHGFVRPEQVPALLGGEA
ncbi:MAG: NAD(P)H-dependent oxidoreductase subunit E [Anaerolineae bacterium]|nr:NAD(P)H-dependent oxidoreductase subunit E [Caldilineales bacterium]MDW8268412.1 NAD(P)H-dependent oxidoreductase subunit E [Anaerolineae bacterium]